MDLRFEDRVVPHFEGRTDEPGLTIVDPIDGVRFPLATPAPVTPTPGDPDAFTFPVDAATEVTTAGLTVPKFTDLVLRSPDGEFLAEYSSQPETDATETFPGRAYSIQVTTAPVALYLRVESEVTVATEGTDTELRFPEATAVRIGVRSFQEAPAGTVAIPREPEAILAAVGALSAGLKTRSPERSFPTLRGHPPLVEFDPEASGDLQVDAAPAAEPIRLELPPELDYVLPAAPLSYYVGAQLRAGRDPRLVLGSRDWTLDRSTFAEDVGDLLSQFLTLDAIVCSVAGFSQVELRERRTLDRHLDRDLDYGSLYEAPLAERLRRYLSLPDSALDAVVPRWHHTITMAPDVEHVEALPYLVHHLPKIRTPAETPAPDRDPEQGAAIDDFLRAETSRTGAAPSTRSDADAPGSAPVPENTVFLRGVESQTHGWLGEGYPATADGKLRLPALRQRPERERASTDEIVVQVICNDPAMEAESDVEEVWFREFFEFDVSIEYHLSRDELADRLHQPTDFLHYIGHVSRAGVQCVDGELDLTGLETSGVSTFLLNGCTSYRQGEHLLDAGAAAGVTTTADVNNTPATEVGRSLARALAAGYQLRTALAILEEPLLTSSRYTYLGDGGVHLVDSESGVPLHLKILPNGGTFKVQLTAYPTHSFGPGTHIAPNLGSDVELYHLGMGEIGTYCVSLNDLMEFLKLEQLPVQIQNELYWSTMVTESDLRELLDTD